MNRDMFDEKDIFKLFNYTSDDYSGNEDDSDVKMDDLRKKRLRKNLINQVKDKNSTKKFKYKTASVVLIAILAICFSMPVLVEKIPVLKYIVQSLAFNGENHGAYEKYSKLANKSVTDNGITLSINEVLCDNNEVVIGYTIKSEGNIKDIIKTGKELIELQGKNSNYVPFNLGISLRVNGKLAGGGTNGGGKYLDDHSYIQSEAILIGDKNLPSVFNADLNVKDIGGVKGNWNFKFSVSKDQILKNTTVFKTNTTVKFPYATINVEKVSFTPLNTSIRVTSKFNKEYINSNKLEEEGGDFKWFVFDDKGNEITEKNGLGGKINNESDGNFWYESNFQNLKYVPKYLTVIPYRINYNTNDYKKYKSPGGSVSIPNLYENIDGVYPIVLTQGKMGKLIIKSITTEQDKTVVKYTVEGKAPFYQAKSLYIMSENDEVVESKNNNLDTAERYDNNPNDYIMEFASLDKNKKYKIGTSDLGATEIRNDLKFRIDLNNKVKS